MAYYAGIVDPNIVVRLEPVGTFTGYEMVAEYLTMFAAPTGWEFGMATIRASTAGCTRNAPEKQDQTERAGGRQ
jgi:hypothetical protein